jgi:hypothetical protein
LFKQETTAYTEITAPDTTLGDNKNDDELFRQLAIGFRFVFNGQPYDSVGVNTNGFIWFGYQSTTNIGINGSNGAVISSTSSSAYKNVFAGLNLDLISRVSGTLTAQLQGTAPNRTFVVQWKNYNVYNALSTRRDSVNFQIRLEEGTDKLQVVYGSCKVITTTSATAQVGLRGATGLDYTSRTTTADWNATTAASPSSKGMAWSTSATIPKGLTYTFYKDYTIEDLNLYSIVSLASGKCKVPDNTRISFKVRNDGVPAINTIKAIFYINGAASPSQNFSLTTPLQKGDSTTLTFDTPITFALGDTKLTVAAASASEGNLNQNDTLRTVVQSQEAITTFPYTEDFGTGTALPPFWAITRISGDLDWRILDDSVYLGSSLSTAALVVPQRGAGVLWYNSYKFTSRGGKSRATSPCLNLSGFAGRDVRVIVGNVKSKEFSTSTDSIVVQTSALGGSFARVGNFTRVKTGLSGSYIWAEDTVALGTVVGQDDVRLGLLAVGDGGSNLIVDYITVYDNSLVPNKVKQTLHLRAYPNPTTGTFVLRGLPDGFVGQPARVVDARGAVVATRQLATTLDFSDLQPGIYYLLAEGLVAKVVVAK